MDKKRFYVYRNSYVRILHASPDAPAVDIYANNQLIARNIAYGQLTSYLIFYPGQYTITIYPTGSTNNPVISRTITIGQNTVSTLAAIGKVANLDLLLISDPRMMIAPGKTMVRFVHLSPNAPKVDITLPDGTPLFQSVAYKSVTKYITLTPGTYTLQVRLAGTNTVVLTVPNVLLSNKAYTIYAIGLAGGSPPLKALLAVD